MHTNKKYMWKNFKTIINFKLLYKLCFIYTIFIVLYLITCIVEVSCLCACISYIFISVFSKYIWTRALFRFIKFRVGKSFDLNTQKYRVIFFFYHKNIFFIVLFVKLMNKQNKGLQSPPQFYNFAKKRIIRNSFR